MNNNAIGKCLSGQPVYKDVKEDESLGRATRYGYKNESKPGDEGRVFGVPTIRNDIQKPSMRSIADPNVRKISFVCEINWVNRTMVMNLIRLGCCSHRDLLKWE